MVVHIRKVISYGSIQQLFHLKDKKFHCPWTGPYQVLEKISDVNYKIAPLDRLTKHSVVHFDWLKLCPPSMRWPAAEISSMPPTLDYPSKLSPHIGEGAQLIDADEDNTSSGTPPTPSPPRYPLRTRHPPDRLVPYVCH